MKHSLIILALAASLLFNLFFVVGYLQARAQAARGADVDALTGRFARELGLDAAQSELFTEHLRSGREDAQVVEDSIALVRREFLDELNRENRDFDRLEEILEQEHELQRQWKLREAARLHELLGSLSSEQCRRFADWVDRSGWRERRREHMVRRFDENGDGKLDEQERRRAREHTKSRRRDRERQWREHLRERFDADGDGRLDEQEQAEAERHMRRRAQDWHMRRELRERFDSDGDGRLDSGEAEALRRWYEQNGSPAASDS